MKPLLPLALPAALLPLACQSPPPDSGSAGAAAPWTPPAHQRPGAPPIAPSGERAADADTAVRRRLATAVFSGVSFSEENGGYLEVVRLLRTVAGLPMVVTPAARTAIAEENLRLVADFTAPVSARDVLDLLVSRSDRLGWTVQDGVVLLGDRDEGAGRRTLVVHDARDLLFPHTEFLPPRIAGIPDGSDTPRAGGEADEKVRSWEPDQLIALLEASVGGRWAEGGDRVEATDSGMLLVTATPAVQRRLERFLNRLR